MFSLLRAMPYEEQPHALLLLTEVGLYDLAAMATPTNPPTDASSSQGPLSLNRLTAAFAQMLGSSSGKATKHKKKPALAVVANEISPHSIIEAVLFVGAEDGRAHTAKELAAAMREVSPAEVEQAVDELNNRYQTAKAPYTIRKNAEGFRLELRAELARMRDKFYRRVKETKLSPTVLEVLSVVAYRQPTTAAAIDQLRGTPSGALLAQLVRRGLVRIDRGDNTKSSPHYYTTDRFLRLFGLTNLDQLPRAAELD